MHPHELIEPNDTMNSSQDKSVIEGLIESANVTNVMGFVEKVESQLVIHEFQQKWPFIVQVV